MYQAAGVLPHLLAPADYVSPEQAAREADSLFRGAWTLVAALDEMPRPGDFVTCEVMGRSLIVRRTDNGVSAFLNACAHRHCQVEGRRKGHADGFACPYHGWRYDGEGRVNHVPSARHFKAGGRPRPQLTPVAAECCGRLVFVRLDPDGPSLRDFLGESFDDMAASFGDGWRLFWSMDLEHEANWKIPIENSLEAYHVASLHPSTFGSEPPEHRVEHRLLPDRTEFVTEVMQRRRRGRDDPAKLAYHALHGVVLGSVGLKRTGRYRFVHRFPNLLLDVYDGQATAQTVTPISPTRCRHVIRQFGPDRPEWNPLARGLMRLWGGASGRLTERIIREDMQIFPKLQRGLQSSRQPGMLGRSEERVHAFQQWVVDRTGGPRA